MKRFAFTALSLTFLTCAEGNIQTVDPLITRADRPPSKPKTTEPVTKAPSEKNTPVSIAYKNEVDFEIDEATGKRFAKKVKQEMQVSFSEDFFENDENKKIRFNPGYDDDIDIVIAYEKGEIKAEEVPLPVITEAPKPAPVITPAVIESPQVAFIKEPEIMRPEPAFESVSFRSPTINTATVCKVPETSPYVFPCKEVNETTCCYNKNLVAAAYLDAGYTFGEGIDTDENYWTASVRVFPGQRPYNILPFLSASAHYLEDSQWAFTLGGGVRYQPDCCCAVLGVNAFYDNLSQDLKTFHQLGFGVEALTSTWEARANLYLPIGCQGKKKLVKLFDNYIGDYWAKLSQIEQTSRGVDAEVGYNFYPCRQLRVYLGAGPAWFEDYFTHDDKWSLVTRALVQWSDYLIFQARGFKESDQSWKWQGMVKLTAPFECFRDYCGCNVYDLLTTPVFRNSVIKTSCDCCWETNY